MKRKISISRLYFILIGMVIGIVVNALISIPVFSADKLVVKDTGGNTKFVVTDEGKVGIGITTPQTSLDTGGGDITVNGADTSGGVGGRKPGLSTPETGRMNIGYGGTGGGKP